MPENPKKSIIKYRATRDLQQEEEEKKLVCKALINSLSNLRNYATSGETNNPTEKSHQGSLKQLMGMAIHSATGDLLYQHDIDYKQIEKHMKNFFNNPESMELIALTSQTREAIENAAVAKGKNNSQNEQAVAGTAEKKMGYIKNVKKIKELMTAFRKSFSPQESSDKKINYNSQPGFSAFIDAIVTMQHNGMETAIRNSDIGKKEAMRISRIAHNQLYEFCKDVYPEQGASPLENLLLEKKISFTLDDTAGTETVVNESILDFLYRDYMAVEAKDGNKGMGSFNEFRSYIADSLMPKGSGGRGVVYKNTNNQETQKAFRENGALTICNVRQYCTLPHNNRQIALPTYAVLLMLSDPNVPEQKLATLHAAYDELASQTKEKGEKPQYLSFKTNTIAYNNLERRNRHVIKNTRGSNLIKNILNRRHSATDLSDSSLNKTETKTKEIPDAALFKSDDTTKNITQAKNMFRMITKDNLTTAAPSLAKQLSYHKLSIARNDQNPVSESAQHKQTDRMIESQKKESVASSATKNNDTNHNLQNKLNAVAPFHDMNKLSIPQKNATIKADRSWIKNAQNSSNSQNKENGRGR